MNSLITGGKGFIGSRLVSKLVKQNEGKVIVIDNNSSNNENNFLVAGAEYHHLDLNNFDSILPIFKGVSRVFHMAADVSIDYCNQNPRVSGVNNTNITLNTLEACRVHKVRRFIFSSTSAVYKGKTDQTPNSEDDPVNPLNLYSASKLFGENLCKIYHELYGLETISLRYFNVFGPNMKLSPYSSVLVKFLNSKKHNKPLPIHGDGRQSRDFIYIDDVVDANIAASKIVLDKYGCIYNIGTGKSLTIKKLASLISKKYLFLKKRQGDINYSCACIKKAKKELKWKPKTNIKQLARTLSSEFI